MRLLIISGQSSALQSATALATACHAARNGLRVLLASTGPIHILGALMERPLGSRPVELEPNLAAMEIKSREELGQRWDALRPDLRSGMAGRLRDISGDELPSFPGMDAVGALMIAGRAARSNQFDLVVFDGPATDSLVRSLTLPDTMRWFVRLIFGIDRGSGRSRASQEAALLPMSLIPSGTVAPIQDFRVDLEQQRARLNPGNGTRVRLALSVEELGLPAVRQILGGLGLYGLWVDTLIVRGSADDVDTATRQNFENGPGKVRPRLLLDSLPLLPTNIDGWSERGAQLYGTRPEGLGLTNNDAPSTPANQKELLLHIPFLEPRALDIAVASEEVVVSFGQFRRHILLPGLIGGGRLRARVEGETLRLWVE